MSAPNLNGEFKRTANLVDSIWGGNRSAFVLQESKDNVVSGQRLELPATTGNREQDAALFAEIQATVNDWVNGGEINQKFEPLLQ